MILVDFNQICIANLMVQLKHSELSEDLIRHMILNSLRYNKQKFGKELVVVSGGQKEGADGYA